MASLIRLTAWIGGVTFVAALAGCSDSVQAPTEISQVAPPTYYPANNCRSRYALTSQKGCVADLPHVMARNVSR